MNSEFLRFNLSLSVTLKLEAHRVIFHSKIRPNGQGYPQTLHRFLLKILVKNKVAERIVYFLSLVFFCVLDNMRMRADNKISAGIYKFIR